MTPDEVRELAAKFDRYAAAAAWTSTDPATWRAAASELRAALEAQP